MACCVQCRRDYHHCSSCGGSDWEWDFCSDGCRYAYLKAVLRSAGVADDAIDDVLDKILYPKA